MSLTKINETPCIAVTYTEIKEFTVFVGYLLPKSLTDYHPVTAKTLGVFKAVRMMVSRQA